MTFESLISTTLVVDIRFTWNVRKTYSHILEGV